MEVAADGLVRLTLQELLEIRLRHFCSGIELPSFSAPERCGTSSDWFGYTEWVSRGRPRISIGWDWRLYCGWQSATFMQEGPARTNLMLVDANHNDLGWSRSLRALATLVRSVDWIEPLARALRKRYR